MTEPSTSYQWSGVALGPDWVQRPNCRARCTPAKLGLLDCSYIHTSQKICWMQLDTAKFRSSQYILLLMIWIKYVCTYVRIYWLNKITTKHTVNNINLNRNAKNTRFLWVLYPSSDQCPLIVMSICMYVLIRLPQYGRHSRYTVTYIYRRVGSIQIQSVLVNSQLKSPK